MVPDEADNAATGHFPAKNALKNDLSETVAAQLGHSTATSASGTRAAAEALIGKMLGKYQVTSLVGRGGMGVVLKARDVVIERDVAIKVLAEHLSTDTTARSRFMAEARSAGKINHPNVVAVYDVIQHESVTYLVLEYVPGGSLEDRLTSQRALPVIEATAALIDACKGVGAAHASGLIHRDIKPANFMRASDGSIKVADFGLAKLAGVSSKEFTQTGMVVGTPLYMSPEQCEAKPLDQRSDIYSLGATYYHLLTGKSPFQDSDNVPQMMYAHCHGPIPDPRAIDPTIPVACCQIIATAMAKSPADRYQSLGDMLADLQTTFAALSGQMPGSGGTLLAARSGSQVAATENRNPGNGWRRRIAIYAAGLLIIGGAVALWQFRSGKPQSAENGAAVPAAPASTLTATAPGVTSEEILLGMSAPFSGPSKEPGRAMQIGIETFLKHQNETAGGVHGRRLKLLALDDGYEPQRCAGTMQEMIVRRPVFAFTGNVGTATAEVALPIALANKRIFFGSFSGAGLLRRDPPDRYVFNFRPGYSEETAAIVHYLLTVRHIKADEIAVFAQRDAYGDEGFSGVAKALRKSGFDSDRIVRVDYERNSMNLDAAVKGLLEHKEQIKAVVMVTIYRQAAAFIRRIVDAGMRPIFASVSGADSEALAESLMESGPEYVKGVIVTQVVPFFGSGASGVLEYRERLARYFPSEQPGFVSLEGYIAARVLCAGLEKAGPSLTSDRLVDALESIRELDMGIGTKVSFGPSEHQGSHKVWATILNDRGQFRSLDLD